MRIHSMMATLASLSLVARGRPLHRQTASALACPAW
ncbi:hypothetical protein QE363_000185 [Sphingomonas sp. SORGH_AS870]|nr:hypothetical protein [Sphingomonas sp. SORGH_AS_0870]